MHNKLKKITMDDVVGNGNFQVLITGATGWLGRALIDMLANYFGEKMGRHVVLCGSKTSALTTNQGYQLPIYTTNDALAILDERPLLVFHFAFLTKDQVAKMSEDEYILRNRAISNELSHALGSRHVLGFMMASSGAVYDYLAKSQRDVPANLYGLLKFEDEQRFLNLCHEKNARYLAPRIFNISGPYINKFNVYALSSIIVNVLKNEPIVLKANRQVFRSYFYVGDLFELVLRYFLDGHDIYFPHIFDTVGVEIVEIEELACRICKVLGRNEPRILRPALDANISSDCYVGDAGTISSMLHHYEIELLSLDSQIAETAKFITQALGV